MTKGELVEQIAAESGLSKKDAEAALVAFTKVVSDNLSKGEEILLVGFGAFSVRQRNARIGHNPKTGVKVSIPASKVPAFRPGKLLRDAVNEAK